MGEPEDTVSVADLASQARLFPFLAVSVSPLTVCVCLLGETGPGKRS